MKEKGDKMWGGGGGGGGGGNEKLQGKKNLDRSEITQPLLNWTIT